MTTSQQASGPTIMVIDDSNTIRRSAEIFLTQAGYQVVLAEDGYVVDLVDGHASVVGAVECGYVYVDGSSVGGSTGATTGGGTVTQSGGRVTGTFSVPKRN